MGSSVGSRIATGKLVGTGALIKVSLDFTPRVVKLMNTSGLVTMEWNASMPNGSGLKFVHTAADNNELSFVTTGGVTPVEEYVLDSGADPGRGFTIGTDTDINVSTEVLYYEATE